jgi:hypothetical protein
VLDATGDHPVLRTLDAAEDRLALLVERASAHYGRPFLAAADRVSRRWIGRNSTPYGDEVAMIAARLAAPGAWFLNASFEWCCTCGIAPDPVSGTMRLLRVLDWPLDGLGAGLVAAHQSGPAGSYVNLTWPGFVGVVTATAPGRFAAAINQAPMPHAGLGPWGDWAVGRVRVWRTSAPPPMHLLRQVFERCHDYEEARRVLTRTPIALPAIFTLTGADAGEGCIIERTPVTAHVHEAPATVTNHWLTPMLRGRSRGTDSIARHAAMKAVFQGAAGPDFRWLAAPMLNETTRMAAILDAGSARLAVQGFEADGPATTVLSLEL